MITLFVHSSLGQSPSHATVETELFALGATMYYALTGKTASELRLEADELGRDVLIGDRKVPVALFDGKTRIETLDIEEYAARLDGRLADAASDYIPLLRSCLVGEKKDGRLSTKERYAVLREAFRKAALPDDAYDISEIAPLFTVRKALAGGETAVVEEDASGAIDACVHAAMKLGRWSKKVSHLSMSGRGSDAVERRIAHDTYLFDGPGISATVDDETDFWKGGTWSPLWREDVRRRLTITQGERTVLHVYRTLGGESGDAHRGATPVERTPWHIETYAGEEMYNYEASGTFRDADDERLQIKDIDELVRFLDADVASCGMTYLKRGDPTTIYGSVALEKKPYDMEKHYRTFMDALLQEAIARIFSDGAGIPQKSVKNLVNISKLAKECRMRADEKCVEDPSKKGTEYIIWRDMKAEDRC